MEMSDTYDEGQINSNLKPQNSLAAAEARGLRYLPMEYLSNVHEDYPNQHENSRKLCNEMGHPLLEFDRKSMETETTT